MSKKTQYSDYVVLRSSGEVFKLVVPFAWKIVDTVLVVSRYRKELAFPKNNLIRVPNEFTAYIKSDNCCHLLDGTMQVLRLDEWESEKNFHDLKEESGVWFRAGNLWVPLEDIDLTHIAPCPCTASYSYTPLVKIDDYIIPPMPSLEELQHCSIQYKGRKTVLTYCDAFVGEAICHKDDEFKVESGIALAYSRAKEAKDEYDAKQEEKKRIKIGDTVRVVNNELFYPWYSAKVAEICQKINNFKVCSRYAYNKEYVSADALYTVHYLDKKFAYIEDSEDGLCYLFDVDGICKEEDNESKSVFEWDKEEEDDWDWLL